MTDTPEKNAGQAATFAPAVMKTEEAATYLGLSPSLLNKLRLTGGGPLFVRLAGRAIRYRRADLDAWIAASAMASTSEYPAAQGGAQ